MAATIQDVKNAINDTLAAANDFESKDTTAGGSESAAKSAHDKATADRDTANSSRKALADAHARLEAVFGDFQGPPPSPPPSSAAKGTAESQKHK